MFEDRGGGGGRNAGGGESWTLRSNGTAEHITSFTPAEMDYELGENPTITKGAFNPNEFKELIKYLQYSKLLDLKVSKAPPENYTEGGKSVSLVRGARTKTLSIPNGTPQSAATSAYWVLSTLVRAITAKTDWKNAADLSVNTGLFGGFKSDVGVTEKKNAIVLTRQMLSSGWAKAAALQTKVENRAYFRLAGRLPPLNRNCSLCRSFVNYMRESPVNPTITVYYL